jgi:hypothetical protein
MAAASVLNSTFLSICRDLLTDPNTMVNATVAMMAMIVTAVIISIKVKPDTALEVFFFMTI